VKTTSLRLTDSERDYLTAGAAVLGIKLNADMVTNFSRFADVLDLWSPRVNLISCGSARELVERHFLDSLALAPLLPETGRIVDLGSGAGFPGLPLAIARPQQSLTLVEVRRRRVNFLREVRRTLGLDNVEILEQRAEILPLAYKHRAEGVVSRAVWAEKSLLEIASGWLRPEGRLFWVRSEPLPAGPGIDALIRERTVRYRIGSDRLRTVEVFRLQPSHCST
jgi:16S rRNA (guanine527-N7)-methyltransferase